MNSDAADSGRSSISTILAVPIETRGFIYLKLGDPAIAIVEYDAALDVDANRALALYGRGLAKIRVGRKTEGQADQAATVILQPTVGREFSAYGVN